MSEQQTFGGKTIVFGGDFRQILPVIPKGRRQDIVNSTINSSYIWEDCTVLHLTKNMRLQSMIHDSGYDQIFEFSKWIESIGDGNAGDEQDGYAEVIIPDDMLLSSSEDPIATIVNSTYPDFQKIANELSYLQERAILAPTLDVVDSINEYMTAMNPSSESRTYLSSDKVENSDCSSSFFGDLHSPEFLNKIRASGVPCWNTGLRLRHTKPSSFYDRF
ncbi:hypothetical protein DM860_013064 [Cuscuta australis]|uniref:ATP-dependent DNA helicase n=1 Tax=Cuscuta australis TaxID=267555 RepID=A0A328D7F1_9ASTE|nr:hypothetical protein DM860_013064 [Cuscuta australis]